NTALTEAISALITVLVARSCDIYSALILAFTDTIWADMAALVDARSEASSADTLTTRADTVLACPSALVAAALAIWTRDASSALTLTTRADTTSTATLPAIV